MDERGGGISFGLGSDENFAVRVHYVIASPIRNGTECAASHAKGGYDGERFETRDANSSISVVFVQDPRAEGERNRKNLHCGREHEAQR